MFSAWHVPNLDVDRQFGTNLRPSVIFRSMMLAFGRVGLLSAFFAFQLTTLANDQLCDSSAYSSAVAAGASASERGPMASMSQERPTDMPGSQSGKRMPCDSPGTPVNCNATASCAASIPLPPAKAPTGSVPASAGPILLIVLAPVSRYTSPEPPPPRV